MVIGYSRISRDEDKENYTSIETQNALIYKYAEEHNMHIDRMFIDDNYSGFATCKDDDTIFNRPDFIEMYSLIKSGKVDILLVKDSSRLGRKNSVLILTLERFRDWGCKCIEVSTGNEALNEITGIISWSNERWVVETSKKVRQSLHNKQLEGKVVMGNRFGYIKKSKSELVIDETIRPCIELIYKLYLDGYGYTKIAMYLNDNTSYPTPSQYYNSKYGYKQILADKWEKSHIVRILSDDVYIGNLTTHKKSIPTIKGKQIRLPKSEHIVHENHHEAIISKEDFLMVQQIRKKRSEQNYRNGKHEYLFSGFGICGDCNRNIGGCFAQYGRNAYNCNNYINYGNKYCTSKLVFEEELINSFIQFLSDIRDKYANYLASMEYKNKVKSNKIELDRLKIDLQKAESEYRSLLKHKHEEFASKDSLFHEEIRNQYEILENELLIKIQQIRNHIRFLESQTSEEIERNIKSYLDIMNNIISNKTVSKKHLELLIDNIIFYKNKTILFNLKADICELYS